MAENKKSFILYADLLKTVSKLPKDKAGELFLIILEYVNDLNPEVNDLLLEIAFEPIKNQLKRDLSKWENLREKRSEAGKASAEKRKQNPTNSTSVESVQQSSTNSTVNVNANVTVNDTVNDILLEKETKEIKKGKSLSLNPKKESIETRKLIFKMEVSSFAEKYGIGLIENFYNYWSELTMDKNKMRFEIQKTWETNLRLATWAKNDKNFNNGRTQQPIPGATSTPRKLTIDERLLEGHRRFSEYLDEQVNSDQT